MKLILDVGSGASLPDDETARRFVEEVVKRDSHKHEIIFKAQLFENQPPNLPLRHTVFEALVKAAEGHGYECTASVFDEASLEYLDGYVAPFIKIACRPDLYWLAGEVPRKIPVYASYSTWPTMADEGWVDLWLRCVPRYPAAVKDYFPGLLELVSDHTIGWELLKARWKRGPSNPEVWEKHLRLPDTTGPDAGPWAVTPDELAEVIS